MQILKWVAERATERTTWIGLAVLLSACGINIAPELSETIATAGVGVGGLILAATKG